MTTFWKDSLLVGVRLIDTEHRELVQAIDNLMDACAKGQGRAAIGKTLDFVNSYTKKHFADEEKLQQQYAYPAINEHKRLHQQFINSIAQLMADFEKSGPSVMLTGAINKTLVDWLIKHISIEDKKLGEHIRGQGGK